MATYAIFNNNFFESKPWWMPAKLHRAVYNRANPRTRAYMLQSLAENFPEAKLLTDAKLPADVTTVILLYPDAIGLGWRKIDRHCMAITENTVVLNGRKRIFNLSSENYSALMMKRFIEVSFLPEIIFAPVLLLIGAILACKDKLLGCSA